MEIREDVLIDTVNTCNKEHISILDLKAKEFFTGWFYNRMFLLLFWIQSPRKKPQEVVQKMICFLDELYHHFTCKELQGDQTRVFEWLKVFVQKHPNVAPRHRLSAIKMCGRLCKAYGLELQFDGPGWRETVVENIKRHLYEKTE